MSMAPIEQVLPLPGRVERPIDQREIGWTAEPTTEEFRSLHPNRQASLICAPHGGEVLSLEQLDQFVTSLPNRKMPIVEPLIYPLWHRGAVLMFVFACLIGEWSLRRWRGLP